MHRTCRRTVNPVLEEHQIPVPGVLTDFTILTIVTFPCRRGAISLVCFERSARGRKILPCPNCYCSAPLKPLKNRPKNSRHQSSREQTPPPPPQLQRRRRKVALITGITGQVGSYLAEFLLDRGYEVHGLIHRSSNLNSRRINPAYIDPHDAPMKLRRADLTDASSLRRRLDAVSPDEVYNLADQYDVAVSFEIIPDYNADVVATVAALRLLQAVRSHVSATGRRHIRYFQAGSSEMFGSGRPPRWSETYYPWEVKPLEWDPPPQSETSPFQPRSPYATSRCAARWYAVHYREAYGLFACNGILFNHESPRQGENSVTRKITRAVGRIKIGLQTKLFLGNLESLDASWDCGFAGDYAEAMWMMLQQEKPDDYVVATEEAHTVVDFAAVAFWYVGAELEGTCGVG
ncbi:hypothetical protein NL676_006426 [Syzygium grande]|nr:hypothetical protein NL676_006426 [Syzygium grande]